VLVAQRRDALQLGGHGEAIHFAAIASVAANAGFAG
jgi:hypothetical protein